ncbi:MAG: MlaD family protein [Gammaproteobacteria bacterium]
MEERAHALIAIVFLAVLGIGAGLVAWWMMTPGVTRVPYVLLAEGNVAGLGPGSPVNYHGVQIGAVRKVMLAPKNRHQIEVKIGVDSNFPLPKGSYATIASQGLIGSKAVEFNLGDGPGTIETTTQAPAQLTLKSGALAGLVQNAGDIMASLKSTLKSVQAVLSERNRKHIDDTLAHIDRASAQLVALEKAAQPAVQAMPQLIDQIQSTLKSAHGVLQQAGKLVTDARQPVRRIGHAASAAAVLATQLNQTTAPQLEALMGRLGTLSERLQVLVDTLQRTPQSLIQGPARQLPGPGETRGTPRATSGGG